MRLENFVKTDICNNANCVEYIGLEVVAIWKFS